MAHTWLRWFEVSWTEWKQNKSTSAQNFRNLFQECWKTLLDNLMDLSVIKTGVYFKESIVDSGLTTMHKNKQIHEKCLVVLVHVIYK